MVDFFCGGGGSSEGARRMGFTVHGVDSEERDEYVARFGSSSFSRGDALSRELVRYLVRRHRPTLISASPPCEGSSTATFGNVPSTAPRLISATRDMLRETGCRYFIENTRGASSELIGPIMQRGCTSGLRTDRPRLFEMGGGLSFEPSAFLAGPAAQLSATSCLGAHARYPRLDPFGRAMRVACCSGNIFTVVGETPRGGFDACADAMGVDRGHMSFATLRKALPPDYVSFLAGHAAMQSLRDDYGLQVVSYSTSLSDPVRYRRQLQHWMRGAGGRSAALGVELGAPTEGDAVAAVTRAGGALDHVSSVPPPPLPPPPQPSSPLPRGRSGFGALSEAVELTEASFRELEHSCGGGFTQSVLEPHAHDWLAAYSGGSRLAASEVYGPSLVGQCSLVVVSADRAEGLASSLSAAIEGRPGTRAVVVVRDTDVLRWRVALSETRGDVIWRDLSGWSALACGHRVAAEGPHLDHDAVEPEMDSVDQGIGGMPRGWKAGVSWTPMPSHDPSRWIGKGLSPEVEAIMTRGVTIETYESGLPQAAQTGAAAAVDEVGQYAWADLEHFVHGVAECDRAIAAGHLVPVPADMVEQALSDAPAHPWTVIHQSADKWRATQDYSVFTNTRVGSKPFTMTSVRDA